jgi:hypothetical protein
MLPRLIRGKFVIPYSIGDRDYLWLPGFAKHQRVSGKEAQSDGRYPMPEGDLDELLKAYEDEGSNGEAPGKHQCGPITGNREQGTGNREQGTGNRDISLASQSCASSDQKTKPRVSDDREQASQQFSDWWGRYGRRVNRAKAEKLWAKLKPADRQACLDAVDAFVASTPDPQFRPHPTTYLNGRRWEDEIDRPKAQHDDEEYETKEEALARLRRFCTEKFHDRDPEVQAEQLRLHGSAEAAIENLAQEMLRRAIARQEGRSVE